MQAESEDDILAGGSGMWPELGYNDHTTGDHSGAEQLPTVLGCTSELQPVRCTQKGKRPTKRCLTIYPSRLEAQKTRDTEEYHEDYEYEDDDEEEDDDDDDDNSDEEAEAIFEKRITLMNMPSGSDTWQKKGMGELRIIYDDDVNGYSLQVISDENKKLCTHMICREHTITVNSKERSCEWQSLDFSTDEPVRQHFRACFSSPQAAQEFAEKFTEGQKLAVESGFGELQQAADFFRS